MPQTFLLWLAAYWTFSHGLLPAGVEWFGLDNDGNIAAALSSRRQALVHVVLDLGNLALTHFILRQVVIAPHTHFYVQAWV